jgi:hypothetical protein
VSLSYAIAWLVPLLAGIAIVLALTPARSDGWRSAAAGYGAVLGLMLTAAMTALGARGDTTHAWMRAAPWLGVVAIVAAAIAWRRKSVAGPRSIVPIAEEVSGWQRIVLFVLLASLSLRAAIAAREVWLRPLYPWDAWAAWAVKAKTWFLLGHYAPYVSPSDWMRAPGGEAYTGLAWHYPNALAWLDVWFASAAGGWIEPLINLPWLGVWIALCFAQYGQWRALGLSNARALLCVYVLGSLPLLTVHAALAGYADLWIGVVLALGVLAWMRWLQQRDVGQLALALGCAVVLPTLKLEGWVWTSSFLAAIGFGALPSRWRWRVLALAGIAFAILFVFGGAKALSTRFGMADTNSPLALVLAPSWHGDAASGIARTLFAQPNWHLLWWLAPLVAIWRRRELAAREWLWLPGLLILGCLALLLFLFLFTDASKWAQSFTAINRLVLQITPAMLAVLVMLLRDARWSEESIDTTAPSDPHIAAD